MEAKITVALVPSALCRPILEKLGVAGIGLQAKNQQGEWIEIDAEQQPIYKEVVSMAQRPGWLGDLDFEGYKTIVSRTSEMQAANKALRAGNDLKGAHLSTCILNFTAEELGYGE